MAALKNVSPTVLIIDDDANIINLLSKRLEQEGFKVISAKDGKLGIEFASSGAPNIILLDLLMPEMSGKEVLKELKNNPDTALIPVIILSAVADTEDKIDGLSMGANDYIVKPFRFQEVLARINTQLRIASMQKELEQKHSDLLEKNKILAQLAITDPLTGLLNKGYLMKRLKSEVSRSARYSETISCMMVDVDFFKKINDSHGHMVGDTVLKHVARIIKDATRSTDIVTRYGGEEFFVICPNSTLDGVMNLAERVRYNVENTPFMVDKNTSLSLTVSIGVKCAEFDPAVDAEIASSTLIHDSDLALYKAKSGGRNRVEIA